MKKYCKLNVKLSLHKVFNQNLFLFIVLTRKEIHYDHLGITFNTVYVRLVEYGSKLIQGALSFSDIYGKEIPLGVLCVFIIKKLDLDIIYFSRVLWSAIMRKTENLIRSMSDVIMSQVGVS